MRDDTPRVGLVVDLANKDGSSQRYECIGITRRSNVAWWRTNCSTCGAPFVVTSQASRRAVRHRLDGLFATKCDQHRRQDRMKPNAAQRVEVPV